MAVRDSTSGLRENEPQTPLCSPAKYWKLVAVMSESLSQPSERRRRLRFRLEFELGYRPLDRHRYIRLEPGKTVNLSSHCVAFETATQLPVGMRVELFLSWPAKFNNELPLKMVAQGRVIRSTPSQAAVSILAHEFRVDLDTISSRTDKLPTHGFVN